MKPQTIATIFLALATLACTIPANQALATQTPTLPVPTSTAASPLAASLATTPALAEPTPTPQTFTVAVASVYIRDTGSMAVTGWAQKGDTIACKPTNSGWCIMDQGTKIWAGCLTPNITRNGCKEK